jgi:glutaredoxin
VYHGPVNALRFALLLCFAAAAHAQTYRWVDEKGRVQYSDTPPPAGAKNVQRKRLQDNAIGRQTSYELDKATRESPVTLYSHPDCKDQCQIARDALNKRGVPFREIVVDDQPKQDELKRVSGGINVPVLVVGAQVETTISAQAYDRALDLAGYPPAGVVRARSQAAPPPPPEEKPAAKPPAAAAPAASSGPYAPR